MPRLVWDEASGRARTEDALLPRGGPSLSGHGADGAGPASVRAWLRAAHEVDRFDLALALRGLPLPQPPTDRELDLAGLERAASRGAPARQRADGPEAQPTHRGGELLAVAAHGADDALDLAVDLLLVADPATAAEVLRAAGLWRLPHRSGADARGRASTVVAACRAALGDDGAYAHLLAAGPGPDWLPVYLLARAAEAREDADVADLAWSHAVEALGLVTELTYPRWASARVAARSRDDADDCLAMLLSVARTASSLPHDVSRRAEPLHDAVRLLRAAGDEAGAALLWDAAAAVLPSLPDDVPPDPDPLRLRPGAAEVRTPGRVDAAAARALRAGSPRGLWGRLFGSSRGWIEPEPTRSFDALRAEQLTRCVCLRSPLLLDDEAVLYAQHHLRPARLDPSAVAVLRGLGPRASLTACPLTGIHWLGVDLAPGAPAWLARGALPGRD